MPAERAVSSTHSKPSRSASSVAAGSRLPKRFARTCAGLFIACGLLWSSSHAQVADAPAPAVADTGTAANPIRLKVIGGLEGVSQYTRYEAPFWQGLGQLTGGRIVAEIAPSDRSGIRAAEMLHLMRLGVVPFGTILLAIAAADEPELAGADLAVLSPDMRRLRINTAAYRPRIIRNLADNYDIEVLALFTYPAQVLFCTRPFTGLSNLAGRRIRTSSVAQADVVTALGGIPVVTPFTGIVSAVRAGQVECAITGTLSGNTIGLHEVTTHIHRMAISWGLSVFAVHRPSWNALPADLRETLRQGLLDLEAQVWAAAEQETEEGFTCNTGRPGCHDGQPGHMQIVPVSEEDEQRRSSLLREVVLPGWLGRCGPDCADAWNESLGSTLGMPARP
ncbi:MAG: TRAP-type C4-dicarboxylate transport system, substrate-binding protein [Rubritepida sp.]|nr:TRAP-type C4-dicarboxylate transport system, substrate-binding protein [Rubritepida sp.]